jgi:hypothetical protein
MSMHYYIGVALPLITLSIPCLHADVHLCLDMSMHLYSLSLLLCA